MSTSGQRTTSEDEPNTSCPSRSSAMKLCASVANSAPVPWAMPWPTRPRATVSTRLCSERAWTPAS